jgi:enoyl-CoA hydratase
MPQQTPHLSPNNPLPRGDGRQADEDALSADAIRLEIRGPVGIITIDRPQVRNAIDYATALAMEAAIDRLEMDAALRALVITGAGGGFCAGADLHAAAAGRPPARAPRRGWFGMNERRPNKPVVAAVEGFAIGGGCELALACDLIVAAEDARFAMPEVNRSLAPAGGGLLRLPRRLPFNVAMEMVLTGDALSAARLFALGLVNQLAAPGQALFEALDLAMRVARNPPVAVQANKRLLRRALDAEEAGGWEEQERTLQQVRTSEDYKDGLLAFAERRPPVWKGQ